MDLRRVVEIKRRRRLSEAALSKLEGGRAAELTSAEAEAIGRLVRGDVGELVAEVARLDEELVEAKRLFREADPALYEWCLGDAARERREESARLREAALGARRASYRLEERSVELEGRAARGGTASGEDDEFDHGDGPHEGPLEELYENAAFAGDGDFENMTADEVL